MARADLVNELNMLIDRSHGFNCSDFEISSETPKNGHQRLSIKYRFGKNFYFNAEIPKERTSIERQFGVSEMVLIINATHSPGELNTEEKVTLHGKHQLLNGVSNWLHWLNNEIIAVPVQRRLKHQEAIIEKMLGDITSLSDDHFSFEESEEFVEKLNELEKKLENQLNEQIKDKENLAAKVEEMKNDINHLRSTVETLSQKGWAHSVANRVFKWVIDPKNSKTIESGVKTVKALIDHSPNQ